MLVVPPADAVILALIVVAWHLVDRCGIGVAVQTVAAVDGHRFRLSSHFD